LQALLATRSPLRRRRDGKPLAAPNVRLNGFIEQLAAKPLGNRIEAGTNLVKAASRLRAISTRCTARSG